MREGEVRERAEVREGGEEGAPGGGGGVREGEVRQGGEAGCWRGEGGRGRGVPGVGDGRAVFFGGCGRRGWFLEDSR